MMTILGLTAKKCAMKRARRVIKLTVCVKMDAILAGKDCIVKKVKKTPSNLLKFMKYDNKNLCNKM